VAKPKANTDPAYQAKLAAYRRLLANFPDVELKGATIPYTAINGNMFSYLHPDGAMALRLAPADREAFLATYGTTLFHAYGIIQKEYVTVPVGLFDDTDQLRPHFQASFDYVRTLKPKATKKKNA